MADETVVETGARGKTRKDKCVRTYYDAEGNELGSRAKNGAHTVKLEVADANWSDVLSYDNMPEAVRSAAALYGAVNSITNTIGKAGLSAQDMVDALEGRIEAIFENGVWAEGAQSGPRTNDVLEAACKWYAAKKGEVTEEWKAAKRERIATDKAYADKLRSDPEIAVLIEEIRMERQAARLEKARALQSSTPTGEGAADLLD